MLNKSKDLLLYDMNGNSVIFDGGIGEYKLELTNGVNQSVVFSVNTSSIVTKKTTSASLSLKKLNFNISK